LSAGKDTRCQPRPQALFSGKSKINLPKKRGLACNHRIKVRANAVPNKEHLSLFDLNHGISEPLEQKKPEPEVRAFCGKTAIITS